MERTTMKNKLSIALSVSLLTPVACNSPEEEKDALVGLWYSLDSVGSDRNELEIGPDLVGTATIYFYYEDSLYYADFTAIAYALEPNRRYEIEMLCDGGCGDLDFEMDCVMVDDRNINCDGDGPFADYENLTFFRY
jgi:hypothetical protein